MEIASFSLTEIKLEVSQEMQDKPLSTVHCLESFVITQTLQGCLKMLSNWYLAINLLVVMIHQRLTKETSVNFFEVVNHNQGLQ